MKISLTLKALRELGLQKLVLLGVYRAGLKLGYFRWQTKNRRKITSSVFRPILHLPDPAVVQEIIGPDGSSQLKAEADEIVNGFIRLFGGQPVSLNLTPPGNLSHWTDYARGKSPFLNSQSTDFPIPDIKFIWEPARFGWAFTLGRAYHLTGDECYPETFWRYFENFQRDNPVNMGPNWESSQEVALRLLAFVLCAQIFAGSEHSSADRQSQLSRAIAEHAARIPPTLIYARAQNNNHLLSEAAGLITASLALPEHPDAGGWSNLGWKWFIRGLQTQIAEDGTYMQQSTNYHRLVLQLTLWVYLVSAENVPYETLDAVLQNATHWLLNLCDFQSGRVPNLGPNDGAYILPLTVQPFADYRPVLQAATQTFLGKAVFEPGPWDEMSLWLRAGVKYQEVDSPEGKLASDARHGQNFRIDASHSWAYLRAAKFSDRPGHADQLHLDLWWRGLNIAQDAGTYLYNADHPWNNALTHTAVHNTVMVDNRQQMTPAGRFLYVDRAQGEIIKREQTQDGTWTRIVASHDGYHRTGLQHTRSVTAYQDDQWLIEDRIQPLTPNMLESAHSVRLHWLLPDWEWKYDKSRSTIELLSPYGWVMLSVTEGYEASFSNLQISIFRAGELVYGIGDDEPSRGWVSPTYGVKKPALSLAVIATGALPITFLSKWSFPIE